MPQKDKAAEKEPWSDKKFLELRTIIVSEDTNHKLVSSLIRQALLLEADDPAKPIRLLINSPGGEVFSGFAMYDTLKFVSCPIHTLVVGLAASMGSILSLVGDSQRVFCLPNARIMIHQPLLTGAKGNISDLKIHAEEITKTKKRIVALYCEKTGKKTAQIAKDIERDHWFTAEEAKQYGLIDRVVSTRAELEDACQ